MSLIRRGRKLLPHSRCGDCGGHSHHLWICGQSGNPLWGQWVYCNGEPLHPETKIDKARRKLLRDLSPKR